jgi:hypothetical protein
MKRPRPYDDHVSRAGPRRSWPGWLAAALLVAGSDDILAQAPSVPEAEACLAANRSLSLGAPLPRTMARLNAGEPVRIVAIGSSSTTGLWMLSPSATYPEVMRRELARLRPTARIEIINSGRIGETVTGSIARFSRDVLALKPDLVIWQLGTNDVAWGGRAEGLKEQVHRGCPRAEGRRRRRNPDGSSIRAGRARLLHHGVMQAIIAEVARQERVGLFSRFALMRRSIEAGLPAGALVSWDGLHNSTAGYDCVGRALARAVHAGGR